MVNLKRELLAAVMAICVASACTFAQKRDDKRPPKGDNKVVAGDKRGEKPPPKDNQGDNRNKGGDKKGKP